ncbi:MAG: hypothetical protein Q8Q30_03010 [Candidatus Woesebacteria bacterium]|nr:hypothetical protein [Candidatus Woesebacteria bacterium]
MKYKRKQKFNIFKVLSIVLIIIFVILIPTIIQKLIKIETIECESQYDSCPQELELRIKNYELRDYKTAKKQVEYILEQNIIINSYLIQYQIPNKLKIDINLKKPRYAIYNNNKYFLIDKDGVVIYETDESNLPILIKNEANLVIGEKIEEKDKFALSIINGLKYLYSINSGIIINEELKVVNNEGIIVRFPLEGDKDVLLGSLRLIFSRLNDEVKGIRIEEIDLRFKNPVLR